MNETSITEKNVQIPVDVIYELISRMDLKSIISFCHTSKTINDLCLSDRFKKMISMHVTKLPYPLYISTGFGQLRNDELRHQAYQNRNNLINNWLDKAFTIRPNESDLTKTYLKIYLRDVFNYILPPGEYEVSIDLSADEILLTFLWDSYMTQVKLDNNGYYQKNELSIVDPLPITLSIENVIKYYMGNQLTSDDGVYWSGEDVTLKHNIPISDRGQLINIETYYPNEVSITVSEEYPTNEDIDESVMVHLTFSLEDNMDYDILIYNHPTGVRLVDVFSY